MEIDLRIVEVHQAALVDHHGNAVEIENLIKLLVDLRVEVEFVLETAASAADDAHAQVDLLRHGADALLLGDDAFDLVGGLLSNGNRHGYGSFRFGGCSRSALKTQRRG